MFDNCSTKMKQSQMSLFLYIFCITLKIVICSIKNCIGYAQSGKCKECLPGFVGEHCSHTCRYPSYGKGCQHVCECDQSVCHVVSGCSKVSECQPGYFGVNCVYECRYPSYGVNCQLFCLCEEQFCDRKTGCTHISTYYKNTTGETTTVAQNMTTVRHTSFQSTSSKVKRGTQSITNFIYSTSNPNQRFTAPTPFMNITIFKSYNSSSHPTASSDIFSNKRFQSNLTDQLLINDPVYQILAIGLIVFLTVAAIYAINKYRKRRGLISNDILRNQNVPVYYEPIQALAYDKNLIQISVPESSTMSENEDQQTEANPYETIENDEEDSLNSELDTHPLQKDQTSSFSLPRCVHPSREIDGNTDSDGYQCPVPPERGRERRLHDDNNEYLTVV
ncbi:uncharacterized protein LOC134252140 isoform X1 [Saccostrea cucullata]|uniref:uncharacterized protein LOC134252140 isoform X1 n=1 Tax=Saccostrea cuccullata TaxID=36930 RepID=UPI002ED5C147